MPIYKTAYIDREIIDFSMPGNITIILTTYWDGNRDDGKDDGKDDGMMTGGTSHRQHTSVCRMQ